MTDDPNIDDIGYDHHPIDDIEPVDPENDIRKETAAGISAIYQDAIMYIYRSRNKAVACWQVFFALDFWIARGKTMTEVAIDLGVKKQAISKGVRAFCEKWNLSPTPNMKSESAVKAYKGGK